MPDIPDFPALVKKVLAERGRQSLSDIRLFNSLLADYAEGEYRKERKALIDGLRTGRYRNIEDALAALFPVSQNNQKPAPAAAAPRPAPARTPAPVGPSPRPASPPADGCEQAKTDAVRLMKAGKYRDALSHLNKAARLSPNESDVFFIRGECYYELHDKQRALSDYNEATRLGCNYALCYTNRGEIHLDNKEYDLAIADLSKAIGISPDMVMCYFYRGIAYMYTDETGDAIADFNKAIALSDTSEDTEFIKACRGWIKTAKGQNDTPCYSGDDDEEEEEDEVDFTPFGRHD